MSESWSRNAARTACTRDSRRLPFDGSPELPDAKLDIRTMDAESKESTVYRIFEIRLGLPFFESNRREITGRLVGARTLEYYQVIYSIVETESYTGVGLSPMRVTEGHNVGPYERAIICT
jgi:hypothetical protein